MLELTLDNVHDSGIPTNSIKNKEQKKKKKPIIKEKPLLLLRGRASNFDPATVMPRRQPHTTFGTVVSGVLERRHHIWQTSDAQAAAKHRSPSTTAVSLYPRHGYPIGVN